MPFVLLVDLASVKLDSFSHCLSLSLCLMSILPAHFLVKYIYKLRAMHLHVLVHIFFSPFPTGNFSMEFHTVRVKIRYNFINSTKIFKKLMNLHPIVNITNDKIITYAVMLHDIIRLNICGYARSRSWTKILYKQNTTKQVSKVLKIGII